MSKGTDFLRTIVAGKAEKKGIPSICSANAYVLKAALAYAKEYDEFVLIESTANQVNQFGGYTGMKPADFKQYVYSLAKEAGLATDKIILGGDHLGPLAFKDKHKDEAMPLAEELICEYVRAGFQKIHIDTSMRLGSDAVDEPLAEEVIAVRGAKLCLAAERAYEESFGIKSDLVYVIGSEVPVPGGTQAVDEEMQVTSPEDFENTYLVFKEAFAEFGIDDAFGRVIAVVVQPGVEFGDHSLDEYDRQNAAVLVNSLKSYSDIVFEAHSTDYQTQEALCEMVSDGFRILKVGPELTFALREGLVSLQYMANEMGTDVDFIGTLDRVMLEKPGHWQKYYTGTEAQVAFKRKYSYSDRWRYYSSEQAVIQAIDDLIAFFDAGDLPLTLLSQFMPEQYESVREKKLEANAASLINSMIKKIISKYYRALQPVD